MKQDLLKKFVAVVLLVSAVLPLAFIPVANYSYAQDVNTQNTGQGTIKIPTQNPVACGWWNPINWIRLDCWLLSSLSIFNTFLELVLLKLAGWALDVSVSYNLTDFASTSAFVTTGWGIVRDITNLFFIFILLWIALATIFSIQGYGAKDLLAKLIIAALLVNFSLAIGGFVINFTNALGRAFYNALVAEGTISTQIAAIAKIQEVSATAVHIAGIDQATIDRCVSKARAEGCQLDPTGAACDIEVRRCTGAPEQTGKNLDGAVLDAIYLNLWRMFLIPILAFVLFAAAIYLLIRYLMLSFLLVFAPIIFLFWILPATRSHWSDWWNKLVQWSFFAPVFFFLLFLSLNTFRQISSSAVFRPDLQSGPRGFIEISFNMLLIVALLIMDLMVAQKMGIMFASTVTGLGKRAAGWTGRQVRGAAYRGAIRGAAPAAQDFMKSAVGQRMAQIPFIRGLTQPAVAIQEERERLDKERAEKVRRATGAMPAEFAAQRLLGESRNVQEAFYKSARPEDVEKIMTGLVRETKDASGTVIATDRSAAEKEIIKVRNRDPKLAERIESSVKDLHLKVVASKGVELGAPVPEAQRTTQDQQRYSAFQNATTAYLNEQSDSKLTQVLSKENMPLEQVSEYILQNFGAREAKAVSRTTGQVRAFADTLIKAVEKEKKPEFTQRVSALRGQGVSEARSRFLVFQELAPQVIQNPSLQRWIASAPGVQAIYKNVPIRESGRRGSEAAPQGGGVPPAGG